MPDALVLSLKGCNPGLSLWSSMAWAQQTRAARGPPESEDDANRVLAKVPAAAKMAAAKAAHVAAAKAAKVTTAKAARVAAAEPAEVAAAKAVAEVSIRELTTVTVEAVAEAKMATVEAGAKAKAKAAVIRPVVAVVAVVAGVAPAVRPGVGIVAGIRITGRDSANHSGRDGGSGIIAVSVAVSVSPNVVAMACVAMCDVLVRAVRDTRVSDPRVSGMLSVSGMLIMTSDSRCICGGKRRRQHQSGRAKRESRNSKSAKSHGDIPFRLATQQRRGNAPFTSDRSALLTDKIQDDHDSARSSLPQLSKPKTAKKALKLKFRMEGSQLEYSKRAHS
jgi:hypothetical protein